MQGYDFHQAVSICAENEGSKGISRRDYFDIMDVRDDEDGLIEQILRLLHRQKEHYQELNGKYEGHTYPIMIKLGKQSI